MTEAPSTILYLFNTTTHALWAEEVVLARGIPSEVVPAPGDSDAGCDLALRTLPAHGPALEAALVEEGVRFRVYGRAG